MTRKKNAPSGSAPPPDADTNASTIIISTLEEHFPGGELIGVEYQILNPHRNDNNLGSFSINIETGTFCDFAAEDCLSPIHGHKPKGKGVDRFYAYTNDVSIVEAQAAVGGYSEPKAEDEFPIVMPVPDELIEKAHRQFENRDATRWWPYRDADGGVLGWDVRFDGPDGTKKVITYTYRDDGGVLKIEAKGFGDRERPIYNQHLLAKYSSAAVAVGEGCKTADAAQELFDNTLGAGTVVATTSPGGSGAAHQADWRPLAGRTVLILPDNDESGLKYASDVARILLENDPHRQVHVVDLSGLGLAEGWDIADLEAGQSEDIERRINSAVEVRELINAEPENPRFDTSVDFGVLQKVLDICGEDTTADPAAILLHLLAYSGVLIGSNPRTLVESTTHHTNVFVAVVGTTASGAKGTANDIAETVMSRVSDTVDEVPLNEIKLKGAASGEVIVHRIRDQMYSVETEHECDGRTTKTTAKYTRPTAILKFEEEQLPEYGDVTFLQNGGILTVAEPGVSDKRVIIVETEMARFLKICNRESNTLDDICREAWDHPPLLQASSKKGGGDGKGTGETATNPHIGFVGHITPRDLHARLNDDSTYTGFANRFLWVHSESPRVIPTPPSKDFSEVAGEIAEAVKFAQGVGLTRRDSEAESLWETEVYRRDGAMRTRGEDIDDVPIHRWKPQVLRLSMIFALLDKSEIIGVKHLRAALAVWDYCEASAFYIFRSARATADKYESKIMSALREKYPRGLNATALNGLFSFNNRSEVNAARDALVDRGHVQREKAPGSDRTLTFTAEPLAGLKSVKSQMVGVGIKDARVAGGLPQGGAGNGKESYSNIFNAKIDIYKYKKTKELNILEDSVSAATTPATAESLPRTPAPSTPISGIENSERTDPEIDSFDSSDDDEVLL